jgi:multiple sugar transport system substrate-binding protein
MRKRNLFFVLTALTILGVLLAACAPAQTPAAPTQPPQTGGQATQAQPQPTQPPAKPAEKVTIRLTTWAGAGEAAELQQILDRINAENSPNQ